jgi:DNA-directed RNA polymerase subunit RPC12/RpoP
MFACMPDARCPHCHEWSRREAWTEAPGQRFPFVIVCPSCSTAVDVHEVDHRLGARAGRCDRCGASVPAHDDPARDVWTLVISESAGAEVVCPRCVNLTKIAARTGVARPLS